mgnify:CR=1 FL=1
MCSRKDALLFTHVFRAPPLPPSSASSLASLLYQALSDAFKLCERGTGCSNDEFQQWAQQLNHKFGAAQLKMDNVGRRLYIVIRPRPGQTPSKVSECGCALAGKGAG